ncbi:glycosyltransferase [Oceanobacillus salinisoli]|uniref:glycosyltransferase n=1 Tax=Oceanobacillus salinisoli TaxID=2678611 RepID=UPI0018CC2E6A|nr:glycosyltransferase [Oceanobacillus salinisoli]
MISVITSTMREHLIDAVFDNFTSQKWEEKELIIILNKDNMDIKLWKRRAKEFEKISVYQLPEDVTVGECQNFGVNKAKYPIIAKFDDDDYYSPYYLKGQVKALKNKGAHIVGKRDCFYYLEAKNALVKTTFNKQNQFVNKVTDSSLMFRKEIFDHVQFPKHNKSFDRFFQEQCYKKGFKIYSTDRYNYTVVRRADKHTHTWQIPDEKLKRFSTNVKILNDYKSYVTKPL